MSTILARVINFLFVPFYTRMLTTESYGVVTEFMSYIAILQVVLVLGLETGCFRFANKEGADPSSVYSTALSAVFGLSAAFLACMLLFASPIAAALGYEGYDAVIKYVGGILFLDSVTAILFAKLRQENRALKFAAIKTLKIITETGANIFLFFWYPSHPGGLLSNFISPVPDFSYVIFAILISCVVCALALLPEFFRITFSFDGELLGKMLAYSLPLMVAALPGILNDFLDRILFRFFDTSAESWRSSLGVFQAAVKLSVIMSLFVQMFRFAAEPFFFQRNRDKDSKELYAKVMEYFTAFCSVVFLGVIFYMDLISLILGRDFRGGITIVPVMLLAYMLLGMNFNVSMWYKLSGKTSYAVYITLAGLVVTILINVFLMPLYSFYATAWAHLASYFVMMVLSAILGKKYYPIPYNWLKIALLMVVMGLFYGLSYGLGMVDSIAEGPLWMKLAVNTALLLLYLLILYALFKRQKPEEPEESEEVAEEFADEMEA
ncbi:MAG: oligosaccharide flippase family protein [Bacteroidales bacterium]|nr:oligosaccharide flippase family protein [Bacteroidales bacterium]